jgi:hypothetical protein
MPMTSTTPQFRYFGKLLLLADGMSAAARKGNSARPAGSSQMRLHRLPVRARNRLHLLRLGALIFVNAAWLRRAGLGWILIGDFRLIIALPKTSSRRRKTVFSAAELA